MFFNSPIPRSGQFLGRHSEGSNLRSPNDPTALTRQYKANNQTAEQVSKALQALARLQKQFERSRQRGATIDSSTAMFPFKVMLSPVPGLQSDLDDLASLDGGAPGDGIDRTWRIFRVRAGAVGTVAVDGTDGEIGRAHV